MYNEEEYKTTYYKSSTGENITENSVPNMDDWGWDNYWNCQDWIEWHKIINCRNRFCRIYSLQKSNKIR